MKRVVLFRTLLTITLLVSFGCQQQLDVTNRNEPTLDALQSERGIINAGTGIYDAGFTGALNFSWLAYTNHEIMGDIVFVPWGNFAWRWVNQVGSITLNDGTVVTPPQGGTQVQELTTRNTRAQGDDNAKFHEWFAMYRVIISANTILANVDATDFTGNEELKRNTLKAWAHFWKGYAYSRIGSLYIAGIIANEPGELNSNFVANESIIAEANNQLDLAADFLAQVTATAEYTALVTQLVPLLARPTETPQEVLPTPASWIRNINTLKARNLLVNKRRAQMTPADWVQVRGLCDTGIQVNDFVFVLHQDDETIVTGVLPHRVLIGWAFASERWVQDFKSGDARLDRYLQSDPTPVVNQSGRGIQYGTRWEFKESTLASTTAFQAPSYLGATYEENELMKAEAAIFTGAADEGLGFIDAVRTHQTAGLPAVSGTGLTQEEAIEELRRERRVALALRGLSFYDARRWGVIDPISQGGGRTGVTVVLTATTVDTNATFEYNYLSYWGVPANELDFNAPGAGSAPVQPQ